MHLNPQHLPPIAFTGVPQDNNSLHLLTEHAKALSGLKLGKALNRKPMLAEVESPCDWGLWQLKRCNDKEADDF